jgi:hypothetical protein
MMVNFSNTTNNPCLYLFAGMLEYQAQLRQLKTSYQLVEERAATESDPPFFLVEVRILPTISNFRCNRSSFYFLRDF